jgi:TetR/AcrR family transcriptional regulator, cholesterol catabolism regulator
MARIPKKDRDELLQETRLKLLDAAALEFASKGYSSANINHISETAGYSKGTVYNYFPSKQALMLALIEDAGARHVHYIADAVLQIKAPVERLERFFAAGFRFVEEHTTRARFLITALYSPGEEIQLAMAHAYQPMFQLVAREIITPGIEQGLFRQANPQEIANLMMTLYLGTCSNVDRSGKAYFDPLRVADFALHALRQPDAKPD